MKNSFNISDAFFLLAILMVAICGYLIIFEPGMKSGAVVEINNAVIEVELAQTEADKSSGLGGRDYLPDNQGMLFVFETKSMPSFWMKGMKFPLDFIWISGDKVIDLTENVPIAGDNLKLNIYSPKEKVDYVLEVNAGFIAAKSIKVGDQVKFSY